MRLTVTHEDFPPDSKVYPGVCEGWPGILSSLKTLLNGPVAGIDVESIIWGNYRSFSEEANHADILEAQGLVASPLTLPATVRFIPVFSASHAFAQCRDHSTGACTRDSPLLQEPPCFVH